MKKRLRQGTVVKAMNQAPITSFLKHHFRHFNAASVIDASEGEQHLVPEADCLSIVSRILPPILSLGDSRVVEVADQGIRLPPGLLELRLNGGNVEAALQLSERMKARRMGDVLAAGRVNITQAMTAAEKRREEELKFGQRRPAAPPIDRRVSRRAGHSPPNGSGP